MSATESEPGWIYSATQRCDQGHHARLRPFRRLYLGIFRQYGCTGTRTRAATSGARYPTGWWRDTVKIPQGELASAWILRQGLADLFIGYAHYAHALHAMTDVHYVAIPDEHNICCEYQLAVLDASKEVMALVEFILSRSGQAFLTAAGFLPLNAE